MSEDEHMAHVKELLAKLAVAEHDLIVSEEKTRNLRVEYSLALGKEEVAHDKRLVTVMTERDEARDMLERAIARENKLQAERDGTAAWEKLYEAMKVNAVELANQLASSDYILRQYATERDNARADLKKMGELLERILTEWKPGDPKLCKEIRFVLFGSEEEKKS